MSDMIKGIDPWFLNLAVGCLAAYFLWSVKGLFNDLKDAIKDLKELIKDLYEHRNDHERRIVALETKCTLQHGKPVGGVDRQGAGRRSNDGIGLG